MNLNAGQKIGIAFWAFFSLCFSTFLGLIITVFTMVKSIDAHKNSSMPGDFSETDAAVILSDIFAHLGVTSICVFVIGLIGYEITKEAIKIYSTPFNCRQISTFFYGLLIFNLILVSAGSVIANIGYWKERAPYFPK